MGFLKLRSYGGVANGARSYLGMGGHHRCDINLELTHRLIEFPHSKTEKVPKMRYVSYTFSDTSKAPTTAGIGFIVALEGVEEAGEEDDNEGISEHWERLVCKKGCRKEGLPTARCRTKRMSLLAAITNGGDGGANE